MMKANADLVAGLAGAYRSGRPLALLFDYDGTLTPIVPHPSQARLPAGNRKLLAALADLPDVFVGVLSGRALDDVRGMVALSGLYYAGTAGMELDLLGLRVEHPRAAEWSRVFDALAPLLTPVLERHPGTWAERKPAGLTLHHRALPDAEDGRFRADVLRALDGAADGLRIRDVTRSLELTPALGWNKGTAVQRILDDAARQVVPLYAGDGSNDAEAMVVVDQRGGYAVGVGPAAPSCARHRLESCEEVAGLLRDLLNVLARGRDRTAPPARNRPAAKADPCVVVPAPEDDPVNG